MYSKNEYFQTLKTQVGSCFNTLGYIIAACVLNNIARRCCEALEMSLEETDSGTDVKPTDRGDSRETSVVTSTLRNSVAQDF